jgi:hypothetical protein
MTQPDFTTAASTVRAGLENAVRDAEQALRLAKWRLQQYDSAMTDVPPADSTYPRKYRTGLSKMVLQAVTRFEGKAFTPDELLAIIHEHFLNGRELFPDVQTVTKTLNKMLASPGCPIIKISQGAGLKAPRFQRPIKHVIPDNETEQVSYEPPATPLRQIRD